MSLQYAVVKLMKTRQCAKVDDLLPFLDGYTKRQVATALHNCAFRGWLSCDGHEPRRGDGSGRGSEWSTYRFLKDHPKDAPKRERPANYARWKTMPRVSSVFQLGGM